MTRTIYVALCALLVHGCATSGAAKSSTQASASKPVTFADATKALDEKSGLFSVYSDIGKGRVLIALPKPDPVTGVSARVIHVAYLRTGLGSNPVGLDRGANSGPTVLRFRVAGDKVFATAENSRYVATTDNEAERKAVEESFATSTVWAGKVEARAPDGRVLVDVSDFLTADRLRVARALKDAKQGEFKLDSKRSAPDPSATLAFPENIELEAALTFEAFEPGREVRATTPVPEAVTLTVHHSFVRLPDEGFRPRAADPRAGVWAIPVADYGSSLDKPIERRVALRYRLEKVDPAAETSPVKKPIIFYVDSGAPEPIRSALIEGVSWWKAAFEAAGFRDAFRVEPLPAGVHPLDARYNVVQWVHRQTRGWSYGSPIYDPRTGEVIKSVITLGSQRVRQDRRIFEGLIDSKVTGNGGANDPIQVALARLRQLAAHEVGHGLGFPHNMAASSNGRASVMDYPAPLVEITADGKLDLSNAYGVGLGAWDIFSARYLYSEFATPEAEAAGLTALIAGAAADRLNFVADEHARPLSAAHPAGSVWDNGNDPVAELERTYKIRRIALSDFGLDNVPAGQPTAELAEVLVPVYLYHRYQVAAAAKLLGGMYFDYSVAGDGRETVRVVDGAAQRRALNVLLKALDPDFLALPEPIVRLLQPLNDSSIGVEATPKELFASFASPAFDEQAAAASAAGLVLDALLEPQRLSRLVNFHARDGKHPSPEAVMRAVTQTAFMPPVGANGRHVALRRVVQDAYISRLIDLAGSRTIAPAVAGAAEAELAALVSATVRAGAPDYALRQRIRRFLDRPVTSEPPAVPTPEAPPGPPIGSSGENFETCWFCEPLR